MPKPPATVKFTSKRLSPSSKAYLTRQANDPYVQAARAQGYRSRAAFKLLEINHKHPFLPKDATARPVIVDLGCAPGGWCQVVAEVCPKASVIGIDLLPTDPLAGCFFLTADFATDAGLAELTAALPATQQIDIVLSDIAANTIGHRASDGLRTFALVEMAAAFALAHLAPGGHFVTKLFMNGDEPKLRESLRPHFEKVFFFKPPASRKDSRETYLLAFKRLNP